MTISLTPLTKNQWKKTIKVLFWVAVSFGLSALVAWLTKNYNWLKASGAFNLVVFGLTQLFQNEETQSQSQLPVDASQDVNAIKTSL